MMTFMPNVVKALFQGLSIVKTRRSALDSLRNACLFTSIPLAVVLIFLPASLQLYMFALLALPIVILAIASLKFVFFDPDRLHTEEHLEKRHALDIEQRKGQNIRFDVDDVLNIENPTPIAKQIPHNKKENGNG